MPRDDVLDYIGYEYVTSHMDKKVRFRKPMRITPLEDIEDEGLNLDFQNLLLKISCELYNGIGTLDVEYRDKLIERLNLELNLTSAEYHELYTERKNIISHVSFDEEDYVINLYFVDANNEDEVFEIMKSNYLSDGNYYDENCKNRKYQSSGGIIKIEHLRMNQYMVILKINL